MTATGDEKKYTEEQLRQALQKQIEQIAKSGEDKREPIAKPNDAPQPRPVVATRRTRPRTPPANKLTREEREQLAADLGLIPGHEEELPFVLPEEPNQ